MNMLTSYCIVPVADITQRMLNGSTSRTAGETRKSVNGNFALLELKKPILDVFLDYRIYAAGEIGAILCGDEWAVPEPTEEPPSFMKKAKNFILRN